MLSSVGFVEDWTWHMDRQALNRCTTISTTRRSCSTCQLSCLSQRAIHSRYSQWGSLIAHVFSPLLDPIINTTVVSKYNQLSLIVHNVLMLNKITSHIGMSHLDWQKERNPCLSSRADAVFCRHTLLMCWQMIVDSQSDLYSALSLAAMCPLRKSVFRAQSSGNLLHLEHMKHTPLSLSLSLSHCHVCTHTLCSDWRLTADRELMSMFKWAVATSVCALASHLLRHVVKNNFSTWHHWHIN